MAFELDGTMRIELDGPWGMAEITDAEAIAHITDDLEMLRFRRTFEEEKHVLDNYDTYWLRFYDANDVLIAETGHLFVDNGQTCVLDEEWHLWRSVDGAEVLFYENLLTYTE